MRKKILEGLNYGDYEISGQSLVYNNFFGSFSLNASGLTVTTHDNGKVTIVGTADSMKYIANTDKDTGNSIRVVKGHNYYLAVRGYSKAGVSSDVRLYASSIFDTAGNEAIIALNASTPFILNLAVQKGAVLNETIYPLIIDLTLLEQALGITINTLDDFYATPVGQQVRKGVYLPYSPTNTILNAEFPIRVVGDNLFNANTCVDGYYVSNDDGAVRTSPLSEGNSASDFIEVEPNASYTISPCRWGCFYDSGKNYIAGSGIASSSSVRTLTAPNNAKYIRFTVRNILTPKDKMQFVKGTSLPPYVKYIDRTIDVGEPLQLRGINGTSHGLPAEYQEVEYIESTGTQWIDTDTKVGLNYEVKTSVRWSSYINDRQLFGNVLGSYYFGINQQRYYETGVGTESQIKGSLDKFDSLVAKRTSSDRTLRLYLNSELLSQRNYDGLANTNYYIFALNNNGQAIYQTRCKMQYFEIIDEGNIVRSFIPCYRKSDNVIGMYDLVSKTFFTNAGTGTFLKGKDVISDTYRNTTGKKKTMVGEVDLGSLNWNALSDNRFISATDIPLKANGTNPRTAKLLSRYRNFSNGESYGEIALIDKAIYNGGGASEYQKAIIRDTDYTDATTFKTAMSGVPLIYELATPTTDTYSSHALPKGITKAYDVHGMELYIKEK